MNEWEYKLSPWISQKALREHLGLTTVKALQGELSVNDWKASNEMLYREVRVGKWGHRCLEGWKIVSAAHVQKIAGLLEITRKRSQGSRWLCPSALNV